MIWIKRLLGTVVIVVISVFLISNNEQTITITFFPGESIELRSGIAIIGIFLLGISFASLIAIYFGIKNWLRESHLRKLDRQRQEFYKGMVRARSYVAVNDLVKAKNQWELLSKIDPSGGVISSVELSSCLEKLGDITEALHVIDTIRVTHPNNVEVLMRAVSLNLLMGNKTAALDHLTLILNQSVNAPTLIMARNICSDLDKLDEALEFHKKLEILGSVSEESMEAYRDLMFRKIMRDYADNNEERDKQLSKFTSKNPEYIPALKELANVKDALGHIDESDKILDKIAKIEKNSGG